MLDISMKPSLMKSIKFGKFSSKTPEEQLISNIAKTDPSYLIWLLNEKKKKPEGEEDWIYTLNYYLK
jgi:hypothetical protein